jgi:hypothetical protein
MKELLLMGVFNEVVANQRAVVWFLQNFARSVSIKVYICVCGGNHNILGVG